MIRFLIPLLISISAHAQDVKECREFVKSTLKPPVTTLEDTQEHGNRFIKDEKKAREYIEKYDAKKLSIETVIRNRQKMMTDCKYMDEKNHPLEYCDEAIFANLDFMRALIHGMKNYEWSKSTLDLGKKKVLEFVQTGTMSQQSLIDVIIPFVIYNYYLDEFSIQGVDRKLVKEKLIEVEKASEKLREKVKLNKSSDCKNIQKQMKEELAIANKYSQELSKLLPK